VGGVVQALALIVLAFSGNFVSAFFVLVFVGAASTTFMAVNNTIIQRLVNDQLRGRVMSFREVAFGLGLPVAWFRAPLPGSSGYRLPLLSRA